MQVSYTANSAPISMLYMAPVQETNKLNITSLNINMVSLVLLFQLTTCWSCACPPTCPDQRLMMFHAAALLSAQGIQFISRYPVPSQESVFPVSSQSAHTHLMATDKSFRSGLLTLDIQRVKNLISQQGQRSAGEIPFLKKKIAFSSSNVWQSSAKRAVCSFKRKFHFNLMTFNYFSCLNKQSAFVFPHENKDTEEKKLRYCHMKMIEVKVTGALRPLKHIERKPRVKNDTDCLQGAAYLLMLVIKSFNVVNMHYIVSSHS